jgi:hypothetical protein
MRGPDRKGMTHMPRQYWQPMVGLVVVSTAAVAVPAALYLWSRPEGSPTAATRSPSATRAARRASHGAPPVIPHRPLGGTCTTCHAATAKDVPGIGVAPPNPHLRTPGMSDKSRCQQCHVFVETEELVVANEFQGLALALHRGERMYPHAPPVLPHRTFMREDCAACHAGPACRPEIRCSHPERTHCTQCHARAAPDVPR